MLDKDMNNKEMTIKILEYGDLNGQKVSKVTIYELSSWIAYKTQVIFDITQRIIHTKWRTNFFVGEKEPGEVAEALLSNENGCKEEEELTIKFIEDRIKNMAEDAYTKYNVGIGKDGHCFIEKEEFKNLYDHGSVDYKVEYAYGVIPTSTDLIDIYEKILLLNKEAWETNKHLHEHQTLEGYNNGAFIINGSERYTYSREKIIECKRGTNKDVGTHLDGNPVLIEFRKQKDEFVKQEKAIFDEYKFECESSEDNTLQQE